MGGGLLEIILLLNNTMSVGSVGNRVKREEETELCTTENRSSVQHCTNIFFQRIKNKSGGF